MIERQCKFLPLFWDWIKGFLKVLTLASFYLVNKLFKTCAQNKCSSGSVGKFDSVRFYSPRLHCIPNEWRLSRTFGLRLFGVLHLIYCQIQPNDSKFVSIIHVNVVKMKRAKNWRLVQIFLVEISALFVRYQSMQHKNNGKSAILTLQWELSLKFRQPTSQIWCAFWLPFGSPHVPIYLSLNSTSQSHCSKHTELT